MKGIYFENEETCSLSEFSSSGAGPCGGLGMDIVREHWCVFSGRGEGLWFMLDTVNRSLPFPRIKRSGLSIVAHFRQISAYLFEDR